MGILAAALLAASLATAILLLLGRLVARSRGRGPKAGNASPPAAAAAKGRSPRACPLCSSVLAPGERVSSKLFPGKGDRIMHIFGCVHCWPAASPPVGAQSSSASRRAYSKRSCPVCGKALEAEGWVVARYFERGDRRHIHVLGCGACRG